MYLEDHACERKTTQLKHGDIICYKEENFQGLIFILRPVRKNSFIILSFKIYPDYGKVGEIKHRTEYRTERLSHKEFKTLCELMSVGLGGIPHKYNFLPKFEIHEKISSKKDLGIIWAYTFTS